MTAKPTLHPRLERPVIRPDELKIMCDRAVAALARDPDIYQRDGWLITVIRLPRADSGKARSEGTPQIRRIAAATLKERLSAVATWEKWNDREQAFESCHPPEPVVVAVRERGQWMSVPPLEAITEAPTLRPDGTLIDKPGYDAGTGVLYLPGTDFPAVPPKPTQADSMLALKALCEPFLDFPFASPSYLYSAVAAILTILARPAIGGSVPCFVFDASTAGSGKTLQTHVITLIATGRDSEPSTFPEDDVELEKVLASDALAGSQVLNFDNVTRVFGGAPLHKVLTARDRTSLRILGQSTKVSLAWRTVILATGNNIDFDNDVQRRVIISRLESPLENPEERKNFKYPQLLAWVAENRARLVVAALTVLRGFVEAGRPRQVGIVGGFEEWSELVPQAIAWAGGLDVLANRLSQQKDVVDPRRVALAALLCHWERLDAAGGGKGLTAKAVIDALYPRDRAERPPDGYDDLRGAIEALCPTRDGKPPETGKLGFQLRKLRGTVIAGRRIEPAGVVHGSALWKASAVEGGGWGA